jgi:undecaprenyl-diphosphatase
MLIKQLMILFNYDTSSYAFEAMDYVVHGVIAIVVAFFFFPSWRVFIKKFPFFIIIKILCCGFITEVITVCFYILFSSISFSFSFLSVGFLITSLLLYSLRFINSHSSNARYNAHNAMLLGIAQGIALMPGISRFGSTFVVARWLGFSDQKAFKLSFLIAWPINCAAFFLGLFKLYQHQMLNILNLLMLLVMLIGGIFGLWCIYVISYIIKKHRLWIFSVYTLILSIIAAFIAIIW